MKFNNANEVKAHLWEALDLNEKSITFHVFEIADESHLYVSGGIVDCSGDLYESDRFYDVGYEYAGDEEIKVDYVESYMIGSGETEHADSDEAAMLEEIAQDSPGAFDSFIREYADYLVDIKDFKVDNPAYDWVTIDDDDEDNDEDE